MNNSAVYGGAIYLSDMFYNPDKQNKSTYGNANDTNEY